MMSDRISKLMNFIQHGTDAVIIYTAANRFYFTGFMSSDGVLVVTKNRAVYFLDGRYYGAAGERVSYGIEPMLLTSLKTQLAHIMYDLGVENIMLETGITVSNFERFKSILSGMSVSASPQLDTLISSMRAVKSELEAEQIEKAQRITEKGFEGILSFIKPGVTEKEIKAELEYIMMKNGADATAFDTIAAAGLNSAVPHAVPGDYKVKDGDFLVMDFAARLNGYDSDMTRTVCIGKPDDEMVKVYNTVLEAQEAAISAVRAGVTAQEVDAAARNIIKAAGYGDYFTHSTGHGVGIDIHEAPTVSHLAQKELEAGNVITIEPGIYLDGKFGVRIEDMVYVTDTGCKNFTNAKKELIIID